ncbi:hypothetical protein D3C80_1971040 [compost metagenome]
MTIRSTQIMVTPMIRYCIASGRCGSMNCGSTASMNTTALGLLAFTRKPRSTSVSGRPMERGASSVCITCGGEDHCFHAR